MATFPFKSRPGKAKKARTRKPSKASILRSWGILGPIWLRYKNPIEKGIYWYLFSKAVRTRDVEKYGTCVSCGRTITVDTCDAGHFIPAASCGIDLLFDPINVNAECSHCNAWDDLHLLGYAKTLDKRYGEETAESLLKQYRLNKGAPVKKDFTRVQYIEKIKRLKTNGL